MTRKSGIRVLSFIAVAVTVTLYLDLAPIPAASFNAAFSNQALAASLDGAEQFSADRFAFSSDGNLLASATDDGHIVLLSFLSGRQRLIGPAPFSASVADLSFSPDGKTLASASEDAITLWDVRTGQERTVLGSTASVNVTDIAFSPDGTLLAGVTDAAQILVWDIATGFQLWTLPAKDTDIRIAFNPDGQVLALASGGKIKGITLWDLATGQELYNLKKDVAVTDLAFSPNGLSVASGNANSDINLWDSSSGQEQRSFTEAAGAIAEIAFNPDSTVLAGGGEDGQVVLWNVSPGQNPRFVSGHLGTPITALIFSPDGKTLASVADQDLMLWDVSTGKLRRRLVGHDAEIAEIAFTANRQNLASVAADGKVLLWDLGPGSARIAYQIPGVTADPIAALVRNKKAVSISYSPTAAASEAEPPAVTLSAAVTLNCESGITCPTTPITVHPSGRYLKGANAIPFLMHGDTAWSAIVQLSTAEMDAYLLDRKNKRFNTVIVNALEKYYATAPPKTKDGLRPFLPNGTDFFFNFFKCSSTACANVITSTETAYWARVDAFIDKAAAEGIMVLFSPAYHGDNSREGFSTQLANASETQAANFGFWLGNRYRTRQNIIWVWGGDNLMVTGTARSRQIQMMEGVESGLTATYRPNHLHTVHYKRKGPSITDHKTAHDDYANYPITTSPKFLPSGAQVDLDLVYTGQTVVGASARAYNRTVKHPTFLYEAIYEGISLGSPYNKPQDMRRQAYSSLLSGSTGHVYGRHPLWCFGASTVKGGCPGGAWNTPANLNAVGTQHMQHLRKAFNSRQWYNLMPDFGAGMTDFVVGGSPTTWNTTTSTSYIARARSTDNRLGMAYLPYSCSTTTASCTSTLQVKVDMARFATPATDRMVRWYNPTNGAYTNLCGSRLGKPACGTGLVTFTTPVGGHSNEAAGAKTNDWLLVVDVGAGPTS